MLFRSQTNINSNINNNANNNTNLNLPADFKPEDISAAQLRELLLKEGVEKNLLDQIDDATLKQMFLEAMKKQ